VKFLLQMQCYSVTSKNCEIFTANAMLFCYLQKLIIDDKVSVKLRLENRYGYVLHLLYMIMIVPI